MHVVEPQAVAPPPPPGLERLLGEHIAVDILITILEEDRLTSIAARHAMMQNFRGDNASETDHSPALAQPEQRGSITPSPYFQRNEYDPKNKL